MKAWTRTWILAALVFGCLGLWVPCFAAQSQTTAKAQKPKPRAKPPAPQSPVSKPPVPRPPVPKPSVEPTFVDITASTGIDFEGPNSEEKKYILESVSGGVALLDYDRDGLLDIYFVDSLTVKTARSTDLARSRLYRNRGNLKFEEVGQAAGVAATGWAVGVCAADVDGNGYSDLYVTGVERNQLLLNQGDGKFRDATSSAGVAGGGWSTGCGFADIDRDGDLDLFVARYLDLDLDNLPEFGRGELCKYRDIPVQCGPRGLKGLSDLFYRNLGDGTFEEVGSKVGLGDEQAMFGLGVTWFDADGDGWQDLYVANDTTPNFLYLNQKDGTFEEMSYLLGVAVSEDGKEQGSMGIAVGDYRNEGWLSLFVTNFSEEYNAFYHNHEGGYFSDASFRTKTAAVSVRHVGWGTSFFDADNDGWLDLFLVNGHVYPQIDQIQLEASAPYRQRRMLFHNLGDGTFKEAVGAGKGPLSQETVSRGTAVGDLDNDGRLDLVISDLDGKAQVLRNETPNAGHWLQIRLEGKGLNQDAVGSLIKIRVGKSTMIRPVRSGTGYLSQDDLRQHFGLGETTKVDEIEVLWPDGSVSKQKGVDGDQILLIRHEP